MSSDLKLFRATLLLEERAGLRSVPVEVRARTHEEARAILRAQYGRDVKMVQDPVLVR